MATQEESFALECSDAQRALLLAAVHSKAAETRLYLTRYDVPDKPGPLDDCCRAHLVRYEELREQRNDLRSRLNNLRNLADLIEHSGQTQQPSQSVSGTVRLEDVTLVYLDDKGNHYEQPLADVPEVGILIDPDIGEDLTLSSAALRSDPACGHTEG